MKNYSIVIPTNKEANDIQALLKSLAEQTKSPKEVIIVRDHKADTEALRAYEIAVTIPFGPLKDTLVKVIHTHTDKNFKPGQGVSYVRNYGRAQVTSPYTLFIDDDNVFDSSDSIQKLFKYRKFYNTDDTVVAPLQYRSSGPLRPSLAQGFSFLTLQPRWLRSHKVALSKRYFNLSMASSNCLLAKTKIFERYQFDENIPFVYEDLILSSAMTQAGMQLIVDTNVRTIHEDDGRSRLAKMYISTPERTYQKAKHRFLLVQALKPNSFQRVLATTIGTIGQTGWLWLHILFLASSKDRTTLWKALRKGTKDGLAQLKQAPQDS